MKEVVVENVRSARDLRAAIVKLAVDLGSSDRGRLYVSKSQLSHANIQQIWKEVSGVLAPAVLRRMEYVISEEPDEAFFVDPDQHANTRPNYRYELLRLLLHATFEGGNLLMGEAIDKIGASETPVRRAAGELRRFGLLAEKPRGLELAIKIPELTWEVLNATQAAPQQLRFRFARGAQIRRPQDLLKRATQMVRGKRPDEWNTMAISGVAAALDERSDLDIIGIPRVDLIAQVDRQFGFFDTYALHKLNPGLEREEKGLVPAPVVVSITHGNELLCRSRKVTRIASHADVYLSLLSSGFPDVARQYAKRVRK
jgi:hypothetical protein